MLVIRELYPLDQPLGKPLLRDGFTFVSSAIGDKELVSALLPDITGVFCRHSLKACLTQSYAKCSIFLIVHSWHKGRAGCVLLGNNLRKEA